MNSSLFADLGFRLIVHSPDFRRIINYNYNLQIKGAVHVNLQIKGTVHVNLQIKETVHVNLQIKGTVHVNL